MNLRLKGPAPELTNGEVKHVMFTLNVGGGYPYITPGRRSFINNYLRNSVAGSKKWVGLYTLNSRWVWSVNTSALSVAIATQLEYKEYPIIIT